MPTKKVTIPAVTSESLHVARDEAFQKLHLRIKPEPGTDWQKARIHRDLLALSESGSASGREPEPLPLGRFKTSLPLTQASHSKEALCVTSLNLEGAFVPAHLLGTLPRSGGKQEAKINTPSFTLSNPATFTRNTLFLWAPGLMLGDAGKDDEYCNSY